MTFESSAKPILGDWLHFRHGTCRGLYRRSEDSIEILALKNEVKGNGDFKKTMLAFEYMAKKRKLIIRECWNLRLAFMLKKHGYKFIGNLFNWDWEKTL